MLFRSIVDGNDFFAVHAALGVAVERARSGQGPTLVEVKLSRFYGHFEGDAQTYRGPDEVKNLRESHDCLVLFRQRCNAEGWLDAAQFERVDAEVAQLIEDAVRLAKSDPKPQASDLLSDVYVAYR